MRSLPLPLRVAAGLAAAAVEQARELPTKIAGLPVTVASQALQMSMRVQQHVTELAIKGDEVLAGLRPVEATPSWATFDEDLDDSRYDASRPAPFDRVAETMPEPSGNGHGDHDFPPDDPTGEIDSIVSIDTAAPTVEVDLSEAMDSIDSDAADPDVDDAGIDPWSLEERALAEEAAQDAGRGGPAGVANYEELSLPQLRARLRRFTVHQLSELLAHERSHGNRPAFVGMLTRRIATVRDQR
jgi:hypothetical protein